jgi:hypothetical protein
VSFYLFISVTLVPLRKHGGVNSHIPIALPDSLYHPTFLSPATISSYSIVLPALARDSLPAFHAVHRPPWKGSVHVALMVTCNSHSCGVFALSPIYFDYNNAKHSQTACGTPRQCADVCTSALWSGLDIWVAKRLG